MIKQHKVFIRQSEDLKGNVVFSHVDLYYTNGAFKSFKPIKLGANAYLDTPLEKLQRRAHKLGYTIVCHGDKRHKYMLVDTTVYKVISTNPDTPPFIWNLTQIRGFLDEIEKKKSPVK